MSANEGSWLPVSLGDVASEGLERFGSPTGEIPVYGVDRTIGLTAAPKYVSNDLSRYKRLLPGMFAYNPMRLNIGSIGYCSSEHKPGLVSPDYVVFRCKPNCLNPEFFKYYIQSSIWREWVEASGVGSVRVRIYFRELSRMKILLPPKEDQDAIARILGALDSKIELNRRMNETLESIARTIFKSWFVDFDAVRANADGAGVVQHGHMANSFPADFEEASIGLVPKNWRVSTLGDEVKRWGGRIQTGPFGSQLHASDYVSSGVPVIMPQDLLSRRVLTTNIARVGNSDAERLSRHRVQQGDIIYSRRGDVERHALIGRREVGWLCGTGCLLVRLGPIFPSPLFASLFLDLPQTRAWIVRHAVGATMANLNTGILAGVPMLMPSDSALRIFESLVCRLADRIIANDEQIESLTSLREALLPRLVSGALRARHMERRLEATL